MLINFLRRRSRYLRLDLLRPGDVILSRPKFKRSKLIAKWTFGKYSHAALVIDTTERFEALGDGLLTTLVKIGKYENHGNGDMWILEDVSSYKHLLVLRHPDLANIDADTLRKDVVAASKLKYLFRSYPDVVSVLRIFSPIPVVRDVASFLGRQIDRRRRRVYAQGPFCSQLIALVYEDLGVALFKRKRIPETVSPNSLRRSLLEVVPGLFCEEDASIPGNDFLLESYRRDSEFFARDSWAPNVKYTEELEMLQDVFKSLPPSPSVSEDTTRESGAD